MLGVFLSRQFWMRFLPLAAVNVIAAAVLGWLLADHLAAQIELQAWKRLRVVAQLLEREEYADLQQGDDTDNTRFVREIGRLTEMRITVIAMDGRVLAESERNAAGMEYHKERVELVEAAASGEGRLRRFSNTVQREMLYFARRVDRDGQPLVMVRTALPAAVLDRESAAAARFVWLAVGSLLVVVLFACAVLTLRSMRPVTILTEAAEAIAAGDYKRTAFLPGQSEFTALAAAINHMNEENNARIGQLHESRQRLATLLGSMVEAVIAVDDRQRILFANSAALRLLGAAETPQGRPLLEAVRNNTLHDSVADALAGRPQRQRETEIGQQSGRVVAVNAAALPGVPCPGAVLVLHDVTELRRLESLRQEFVANVSHELKTPLSSIKAYAETLKGGAINDPDASAAFVARIEEQAERLHQLILDMLSLARIEAGRESFDIRPVPIERVAAACIADHRAAAEARRISIGLEGAQPQLRVKADEEGLRQILDNLIDNAVKYSNQGGAVLVRWREEGDRAVIDVQDNGIGISVEAQSRVFERFYRVDKARSVELGGTGLGLSIVKHLTQSFGGAVQVASRPGEGTTFTVILPLDRELTASQ